MNIVYKRIAENDSQTTEKAKDRDFFWEYMKSFKVVWE